MKNIRWLSIVFHLLILSTCSLHGKNNSWSSIPPHYKNSEISHNSLNHIKHFTAIKKLTDINNHTQTEQEKTINFIVNNAHHWKVDDYWEFSIYHYGCLVPCDQIIDNNPYLRFHGYYGNNNNLYFDHAPITRLMHEGQLYSYKNFREFVKRFSWYEDELLILHKKVNKKGSRLKRLFTREVPPEAKKTIESEYQKIVAKRREINQQERRKKIIADSFHRDSPTVATLVNELEEISALAPDYQLSNTNHYDKRQNAVAQTLKNLHYIDETYTLNNDTLTLLSTFGYDQKPYLANYGNQLQHALHKECIAILEQTAQLSYRSPIYDYQQSLVHLADASREFNQIGKSSKAFQLNDLCFAILDYGAAIVEGVACGLLSAGKDILDHPLQTALCVVAGEYVLAYQLLKVTTNLAHIGITYAWDKEKGKQEWDAYIEPITSAISAINKQELTLRDGIKAGVAFGTSMYAQQKMLLGLNSFYTTTKTKALEFAKNNPLVEPAEYIATAEGVLLKTTKEIASQGSKHFQQISTANSIRREVVLPKVKTYEQARNKALEIIGKVDPHTGQKHIGTVGLGEGKIVGRKWHNGKVLLRLDYDPTKGPHINIDDYRLGKGVKGLKFVIPFEGNIETVESLLKHLQR